MAYVELKRKELKTKYLADTHEVGQEQGLLPHGLLALNSTVTKTDRIGMG